MNAEQITAFVDPDVAVAYRSATDEERRKLDMLVNLRLRDATRTGESLADVMRQIGESAQQRGITPEILQSILDER